MLESEQVTSIKAQLLGFLLYGSPEIIARLLKAFGSEEISDSASALEELLPGPHPVLRCLISVSSGKHCNLESSLLGAIPQD